MAFRNFLILAACLSGASASAALGRLQSDMQPDVVARTLGAVQSEWKAQVAVFSECDSTAKLPGSPIVNCKDAHGSFAKSCGTISNAIVQGSGGDKDIMNEYMTDVCRQPAMSGWHQSQCKAVALAVGSSMSADKYQNRMSFKSDSLCNKLWSQLLGERAKEVVQEKAEREAADKKAAEEAAEEEKARVEAQKKDAERKKAEEAERQQQEAAAKAAEAKAKAAEAAAKAAEKKAEAEAVAASAEKKMSEVAAAEKARIEATKNVAPKETKVVEAAPKPEAAKPVAEKVVIAPPKPEAAKPVTGGKVAATKPVAEKKAATPTTAAKAAAEIVSKSAGNFLVAAAPAPAAAGAPAGGPAGGKPENLNDNMPMKAAEQGFSGKKVQHADGKTAAADWQNEYATKASFLASGAGPAPAAAGAPAGGPAGGKPEDLNKKMPLKAAEQGFTGKKVKHADGETAAADWQNEYATKASFLAAAPAPAAAGGPAGGPAGGKPENLNKKMPLKAAEQGFSGKKVKHADGETAAADWQNEYKTH